jgi:hypothetical protein
LAGWQPARSTVAARIEIINQIVLKYITPAG